MSTAPFLSFEVIVKGETDFGNLFDLLTQQDLEIAASTGLALLKERIQNGKRADGAPLKAYSRKRAWIPVKGVGTGNPTARPRGGKLSRTGKTMRFEEGYAEFRDKAGRGSSPVNLTLSGNTTGKRFRIVSRTKQLVKVGWPAGSLQAVVAAGLDARDEGQVFSWSADEQKAILESLQASIYENLQKAGVPLTPAEVEIVGLKERKVSE